MIYRYLLPALAVLGLAGAIAAVLADSREQLIATPTTVPASSPYPDHVAGAGIVEASSGNILIGSPVAGVATEIHVHVDDFVEAGAPLFQVDDRDIQAQLVTARARVVSAEAALQRLVHRLGHSEALTRRDAGAVSAETLTDLRDQVAIAEADLGVAKAQVTQLDMESERYTVRAPVAGRVLQLNLRQGEYVDGSATSVVLFGDDRTLFVRVDIDESDAWRVLPGAQATAFVRGNAALKIPLTFEYVEPHIIPKTSLTGRSTERTDTRVLQVLYSFRRDALPVHIGQQLDVFIEAPAFNPASASPNAR